MKIYIFYQKADNCGILEEPVLYAITNKKELFNSFKETRNMKLFMFKEKDIDKKEYKLLADKYKRYILRTCEFSTRSSFSPCKIEKVCIAATDLEEQIVYTRQEDVFRMLGKFTDELTKFVDSKYLKVLEELEYFSMRKMYVAGESLPFYDGLIEFLVDEVKDYKIDELNLFLYFYGKYMKINNKRKEEK